MSDPEGQWSEPLYARAQEDMTRAMQAFMEDALTGDPTIGTRYEIARTVLGTMSAAIEDRDDGRFVVYQIEQHMPPGFIEVRPAREETARADGEG